MYTIVDSQSGLVLFSKSDSNVLEGQVAIEQICIIERENPQDLEFFYNFETQQFYTK
jgi:hypothetical protein